MLGSGITEPEESKVQAIEIFTVLIIKKQVMAFLGIIGSLSETMPP